MNYQGPCLEHCYYKYNVLFLFIGIVLGFVIVKLFLFLKVKYPELSQHNMKIPTNPIHTKYTKLI